MKSTTNVFLEGLRTDLHPLSTSQQYLTDALNATMITYNGNEMMLQNDMGNTLIQDSATGNIMGLNPGFIPVGMKEHGGIMYIASVDKEGNGEIGTIPSPIIRDLYKDKVSLSIGKDIPIDSGDPIQITNKLYPADKFIANLQMTIDPNTLKGMQHTKVSELVEDTKEDTKEDPCDIILERQIFNGFGPNNSITTLSIYSPVISYSSDSEDKIKLKGLANPVTVRKKGIYNLNLYSFFEQGKSTAANLNLLSAQVYGANGDKASLYWFLHTDTDSLIDVFPKDLFNATLNNDLKQVPVSNKPGKLAVKLIPETITDFGMLPRALEPYNTPITYKTTDGQYYTYFPGFYYTSDNGLYVEKLTARVIDESTNLPVVLEYPYGKEVLFDRYDLSKLKYHQSADDDYNDPFLNGGLKLWDNSDNFGLPHSRARSLNTQILSPIVGLHTSQSTNFKSSTQGKDDSPHSGVFRAVLGENYNRWYRLEVDYEDQYGGNKGTFTTRFNPYLNDVFGTNLSVSGKIDAKKLKMGPKNISIDSKHSNEDSINVKYVFKNIVAYYQPEILFDDSSGSTSWGRGEYNLSGEINGLTLLKFSLKSSSEVLTENLGINYTYLFNQSSLDMTKWKILSNEVRVLKGSILSMIYLTRGIAHDWYIVSSDLMGDSLGKKNRLLDDSIISSISLQNDGSDMLYWNISESNLSQSYRFPSLDPTLPDSNFSSDNLPSIKISSDNLQLDKINNTYTVLIQNPSDIDVTLGSMWHDGKQLNDVKFLYVTGRSLPTSRCTLNFNCKFTNTLSINTEIQPSYSITPYFCLTGTTDGDSKVYVQRFGKEEGVDIVYEHNFELNTDGSPHNYFREEGELKNSEMLQCSYTHISPFKYYYSEVLYNNILTPGIYVLNILRVPGIAEEGERFNHNVPLSIKIDELPEKIINPLMWRICPDYTNGISNYIQDNGYADVIYRPIVLIVPKASKVTINTQYSFLRQNIGLFKINNINDSASIVELLNIIKTKNNVMFYDDYMWELEHCQTELGKVERYAFIQKYGIFFKEAYVFIDGLINENTKQIKGIIIGDNSYESYPYIPSDPSVLPAQLSTEGEYTWNAYVMPESVLNVVDDEYPNFIFSNPLDQQSFSTKPDSGNLRQLIEL